MDPSTFSTLFWLLSIVSVMAALVTITRKSPLPAAFALVVCFAAIAGLFALLSGVLLAVLQILVYAGAIMALVVFVIMLLNVQDEDLPQEENMGWWVLGGLATGGLVWLILVQAIHAFPSDSLGPPVAPAFGTTASVANVLFMRFGFPFEIISLLLTVAVVGVVVLAKRRI